MVKKGGLERSKNNNISESEMLAALDKLALLKLVFSGQFQTMQLPGKQLISGKTIIMDNNQANAAWKTINEAETALREVLSTVSTLSRKLTKIKSLTETYDALESMPGEFRQNVWKELKKETGLEPKINKQDIHESNYLNVNKRLCA